MDKVVQFTGKFDEDEYLLRKLSNSDSVMSYTFFPILNELVITGISGTSITLRPYDHVRISQNGKIELLEEPSPV